uniref:Cytosol aminopeptidase n=1 Tax=Sinonovacula constricta TaxID=98310 RepID=A0A2K9RG57_SINCO|nr:leucine aminopeptidase 3 [Sinonovacula constricta]
MAASIKVMNKKSFAKQLLFIRRISTTRNLHKGAVIGVYEPKEKGGEIILNKTSSRLNEESNGKLLNILKVAGKELKKGGCRVLYDTIPSYSSVAVCSLGKQGVGFNEAEGFDEAAENVRAAVAAGVRSLRDIGENQIDVDPCGNIEAAAEGGHLALYVYDELKSEDKRKKPVKLSCLGTDSSKQITWNRGVIKAEGQNWARSLMEMPSNFLTPRLFAEAVKNRLNNIQTVKVNVRDKTWIENEKMESFLAVSQGSAEPPVFLHLIYKHPDATIERPLALVGKGVTFDTGGISIKPSSNMDQMRADMGGAACVVGALYAISRLNMPVNVEAFIPLCENMPGGRAIKPGDVVRARNGKTIQIDNTDAEGRLILADALNYAETVKPHLILDMATLTGAIDVALGAGATGVFSTSTHYWSLLEQAGSRTGDRVRRMPLFNHYTKQITKCQLADVNNIGGSRSAGACTAAAFLKEFVTCKNWMHLDIAGVMSNKSEVPYLGEGMAGRPTRTVVEFVEAVGKEKQ